MCLCEWTKETMSCVTYYLSRHCFPIRPGNDLAMTDHFVGPYFATN